MATPPPPMIKSCHLQPFFLYTYKDYSTPSLIPDNRDQTLSPDNK